MVYRFNPFTNNLDDIGDQGGAVLVETLTGNSGGAVPPTAGNINVVGAGGVTVTGNPGTSTLTIKAGTLSLQRVYVDAQAGSDTTGNGSAINPFATITHANSTITTNSTSNRYVIVLTGVATEAAIAIKPFVSIAGFCPNSARISVSGAGNHITLDASWTAGSTANLENLTLVTTTNLSFNTSAVVGAGTQVFCYNVLAASGATWVGRAAASDNLILTECSFGGAISITDANLATTLTTIAGASTLTSTNATSTISWISQADSLQGVTMSETSGQITSATFNGDNIAGSISVTGATANAQYDAVSYPQGGFTLATGGTAVQVITSPGAIPHTSVTGANYTVVGSDYFLACNRAGAIALTFPSAIGGGRTVIIKDVSGAAAANNITATSAGATFDGAGTLTINTNFGSVTVTDTATNVWSIT